MKKVLGAVFGSTAKNDNAGAVAPHCPFYGGLLNQSAYGK